MTAFRILRWGSDELPPAVCLHDVRGHARRFERVARMLERGRLVVAYDLRGHGRSPWSGPQTIEQHADDLHEAGAAALEAAAHPEARLADVLCPTMLVHGHESRWLTDGDVEAAHDAVRRLRVEEVPGGHVVLWDAMAETSALVRDFLVAKDR